MTDFCPTCGQQWPPNRPFPAPRPVSVTPVTKPVKPVWPLQSDCDKFYGDPRNPADHTRASTTWEAKNLGLLVPPFRMYYAGKAIRGIRCHVKVIPSLDRVLKAIWIASGKNDAVLASWGVSIYSGAYNYRLMRGGDRLSMHSYGCAIDFDAARNGFGDPTPHLATVPAVLKAFDDEGWTWGGKWSKPDGMHFQAARVR